MIYDLVMAYSKRPISRWVGFLWGLAEGTFFFIVPDFYVAGLAIMSPVAGLITLGWSIVGSLTAAAIIFASAPYFGGHYEVWLQVIPGISSTMINHVQSGLANHGLVDLVRAPLGGVPYKVYAVEAAVHHSSFWLFALYSIPARLIRLLPVTFVAAVVGRVFRGNIKVHPKPWLIGYLLLWIGIYVWYFTVVANRA